jgi:hypothetical protein
MTERATRRYGLRLALLAGAAATLWVGSNAWLERSASFWIAADALDRTPETEALKAEAAVRGAAARLSDAGATDRPRAVFMGSSIVRTNIDPAAAAKALGGEVDDVLLVWMDAGSEIELAMLAPALEALAPRRVVYLATIWTLYRSVDAQALRLYEPSVAVDIFGPSGLTRERGIHVSKALASQHVAIRHREALLSLLPAADRRRDQRTMDRRRLAGSMASPADFGCDSANVRALAVLSERLSRAGVEMWVVAAPFRGRLGSNAWLQETMDRCFSGLASERGFRYVGQSSFQDFTRRDFWDGVHLGTGGRDRFTQRLLERIVTGGAPG